MKSNAPLRKLILYSKYAKGEINQQNFPVQEVNDMIKDSDNEATSKIVDIITGQSLSSV